MTNKFIFLTLLALINTFFFAYGQSKELQRSFISPTRIVWQSDTTENQLRNVGSLLGNSIHQADLYSENYCELKNSSSQHASIILDFGKEIQGGIQLVTAGFPGKDPISVRLRFGESVSETLADIGEDGATNDHAIRDFTVELPWMGKLDTGSTGFRFVRIDLLDSDRTLFLKEVSAISEIRDIPYLGSFECDNETLNKIWQTGAYTVQLNMQEYLWDGIKRDRLVWVGDMHPEVMTIIAAFGHNEVVPKTLDYIKKSTPESKWMNGISSYTMWWVMIHQEWYKAHGDIAYLQEQHEYLSTIIHRLCAMVDQDGEEQLDGWRFLDWPSSEDKQSIKLGYQSLLLLTLKAGAYLSDQLEDKDSQVLCKTTIKRMEKAQLPEASTKQAAALLYLAGLSEKDNAGKIILNGMGQKFSTFYGFYMLEALAKAGKHKEAIEIIKSYWGGMLDLGATSFWEDFNIDWMENAGRIDEMPLEGKVDVHRKYGDYCYKGLRHSFCHGWASGPTPWLSKHVLGINILEPACKKIRVTPHLGNLKWAKGSFPTPFGVLIVEHHRTEDGKIKTKINAPKGITIIKN